MKKTALILAALFVATAAQAGDEPRPARPAPFTAPRNAYGQPDLNGTWTNVTLTPTSRPSLYGTRGVHTDEEVRLLETNAANKAAEGDKPTTELNLTADNVGAYNQGWIDGGSRVMRVGGEARTSILTTPDGMAPVRKGQPARVLPANAGSRESGLEAVRRAAAADQLAGQGGTAGQAAALRSGAFDNPESRGLGERCILSFGRNAGPPMLANGWYNNNYQFVQSRTSVIINVEMVHENRIIHLNTKHRTDGVRPYFGDSIGWYEGDTLVVETTNIPRTQAYNGSWENLKVTERFTPVAGGRMRYRFEVEDDTVWDKPWGGEYEFSRLNGQIVEYACHEGNYALEGVLAGAREQERQAAAAAAPPVASAR